MTEMVEIVGEDSQARPTECVWEQDGLMVNRALGYRGRRFTVAHRASGQAIFYGLPSKKRAVAHAETLLLSGVDWTRPADVLKDDPKALQSAIAVRRGLWDF